MAIQVNIFNDSGNRYLPKKKIEKTVKNTLRNEKVKKADINVVLSDDKKISELNKKYLNHIGATDVITFSLDDVKIEGEIYISVDTARENSRNFKVSLTNELMRLASHGALHLAGYSDETDEQRQLMHTLESKYIDF